MWTTTGSLCKPSFVTSVRINSKQFSGTASILSSGSFFKIWKPSSASSSISLTSPSRLYQVGKPNRVTFGIADNICCKCDHGLICKAVRVLRGWNELPISNSTAPAFMITRWLQAMDTVSVLPQHAAWGTNKCNFWTLNSSKLTMQAVDSYRFRNPKTMIGHDTLWLPTFNGCQNSIKFWIAFLWTPEYFNTLNYLLFHVTHAGEVPINLPHLTWQITSDCTTEDSLCKVWYLIHLQSTQVRRLPLTVIVPVFLLVRI